jgi:AcrR family transcriptional regulator
VGPAAVKPRKIPRQERSRFMNDVILDAAARVLAEEGAARFTTNRVAERAGVSIGSLYQYYPNKGALLYCMHQREDWGVWSRIQEVLANATMPPRLRLEKCIRIFFASEFEELEMRTALQDARALLRDTPEFQELDRRAVEGVSHFLRAVLPAPRQRDLDFKASFVLATVTGMSESISARPMPPDEISRYARACAAMLADYLGL